MQACPSRWSQVAALALLACVAAGCDRGAAASEKGAGKGGGGRERGAGAEASGPPRAVTLTAVRALAIPRTVFATGTLAADDEVVVGAGVAGRLEKVAVDFGTPVRRGDVIAAIETADLELGVSQAAAALAYARSQAGLPAAEGDGGEPSLEDAALVRQALATLQEARTALERALSLSQQGLNTPADLDVAQAAFKRAESAVASAKDEMLARRALARQRQAELGIAQRKLDEARIKAPLDGVVSARHASAGEHVTLGAPIATIVRTSPLRLRLEVPERDGAGVRAGQTVALEVDGDAPGRERTGTVVRIAPVIGASNRVLVVEAEVQNQDGSLRPGGFARAEIQLAAEAPVPVVLSSAVISFAGIEKVIVVEKGAAAERRIRTGRRAGDSVEVLQGLEVGAPVVASPTGIRQGQPLAAVAPGKGE